MRLKSLAKFAGAPAVYLLGVTALRPWYLQWGATDAEAKERLPGDEYMHRVGSTRAITIEAPLDEVWAWLVQIGQDRAGFYSYDWLERLVGADIHNVDHIVPEWQRAVPGDFIRLASKETYGDRPLLRILAVEPRHFLVLDQWGAFIVMPAGPNSTRLIIRTHAAKRSFMMSLVDRFIGEPIHFVMERKMMLGIKERAERGWKLQQRPALTHSPAA